MPRTIEKDFVNKLSEDLIDVTNKNIGIFGPELDQGELLAGIVTGIIRYLATTMVQLDQSNSYTGADMKDEDVKLTKSCLYNQMMINSPRMVDVAVKAVEEKSFARTF